MDSIWTRTAKLPSFPTLAGDLHADAAIIGGGMAGILTAFFLRQRGVGVVVLEADRIGMGQTAGTTAKLTAQHGLKYTQLAEALGDAAAARYAAANQAAVVALRRLVRERNINCDFADCTSFLYAAGPPAALEQELYVCRQAGLDVFLTTETELPFPAAALGMRHQARFHSLRLLAALAEELPIYEHTRAQAVEGHRITTDQGTVTADKVIFTCHFPFPNTPGLYFARQHQERSYVLALEGPPPLKDVYLGVDGDQLSFRSWGPYLLLGGGGHRTGDNRSGGKYELLRQAARRFWPDCREVAAWSAQDCMPMDGIPYVGRFSASRPDWLVATGFQKWGMTTSVLAAQTLTALVLGQTLPAGAPLFSPSRFHAGASARQIAEDAACSVKGLSRRLVEPGRIPARDLPRGHGGIVELDGEKLGAYRDAAGELFTVVPKCPHLGCQLEWNPDERSWDCPCHGSRFDFSGRLLDGPAQTDL